MIEGSYNVAIGLDAGYKLTSGSNNVLIGARAGKDITTGCYNIGLGTDALKGITTESGVIDINGVQVTDLSTAMRLTTYLHTLTHDTLTEMA